MNFSKHSVVNIGCGSIGAKHLRLSHAWDGVEDLLAASRQSTARSAVAYDSSWTWHEAAVADRDSHFVAQANAFLAHIEGKPAQVCSVEAAVQTLRFNFAALASAASGTRINCKDIHA